MWCKYAGLRADLFFSPFLLLFSKKYQIKSDISHGQDSWASPRSEPSWCVARIPVFSFLKIIILKPWRKHPYDGLMTFISFDTGLKHKVFLTTRRGEKKTMKRTKEKFFVSFCFFLFFPIVPAKTRTKSEFSYFFLFFFIKFWRSDVQTNSPWNLKTPTIDILFCFKWFIPADHIFFLFLPFLFSRMTFHWLESLTRTDREIQ